MKMKIRSIVLGVFLSGGFLFALPAFAKVNHNAGQSNPAGMGLDLA